MTRTILFVFAGREPNLTVQRPFLDRILAQTPEAEVHLWNLTRHDGDDAYVRGLHDPDARVTVINDLHQGPNDWPVACRKRAARSRWCGCKDCRPAPFESVYHWYAERDEYAGAVFVKLDDDVVWLETDRFGDLLSTLEQHPRAVVSANVVNNVVSAKHTPDLRALLETQWPLNSQRDWFDLHIDPDFARISHQWFLRDGFHLRDTRAPRVTRALPGERPSINCVAFTHDTMRRLSATMKNPRFARMGDEGSICQNFLPRIVLSFHVAHLYFGPQRVKMSDEELDGLRNEYAQLGEAHLS